MKLLYYTPQYDNFSNTDDFWSLSKYSSGDVRQLVKEVTLRQIDYCELTSNGIIERTHLFSHRCHMLSYIYIEHFENSTRFIAHIGIPKLSEYHSLRPDHFEIKRIIDMPSGFELNDETSHKLINEIDFYYRRAVEELQQQFVATLKAVKFLNKIATLD